MTSPAYLDVILISSWKRNHKKRKDSLKPGAELAVLRTYVENQTKLGPILLYRASKYKQIKDDCLWTHIFTLL